MSNGLSTDIRRVLSEHARLPVDIDSVGDEQDLFAAGMTSHASVNVMLALEDEFDVEFPDHMLKRSVFESISAIAAAIDELADAQRHDASPSTPTGLHRRVRRIADEVAAAARRRRRPRRPLPASRRSTPCASSARSRRFVPSGSAAAASHSRRSPRPASSSAAAAASTAMVFAMHQIQVASIVRHLDGAPWFDELPARARRPSSG